jgi:outer membrane protein assembly factor BamB
MTQKDYFTPDQVDQQIEQLLQASDVEQQSDQKQDLLSDIQLTTTLRYLCQKEANDVSLQQVKQRLVARKSEQMHIDQEPPDQMDLANDLQETDEVFAAERISVIPTSRRQGRISHRLNILAAVLLIGLILGSWVMIMHIARPGAGSLSSQGNQSGKAAANVYVSAHNTIYKLNGQNGSIIWQHQVKSNGAMQLMVVDGRVYAVQSQDIYAFNTSNGKAIWHKISHGEIYIAAQIGNGRLYLCADFQASTAFIALNISNGAVLWTNMNITTGYGEWFSVQDGSIYVKTDKVDGLYAIDAATGRIRWRSYEKSAPGATFTLVANGVVYDTSGRYLYALNEANGQQLWTKQILPGEDFMEPRVSNGTLYVGSAQRVQQYPNQYDYHNLVHAFNAKTGAELWTLSGYTVFSGNVPVTDGLLIAERNYHGVRSLNGIDARTGAVRWTYTDSCQPGKCLTSWGTIANGIVYFFESSNVSQKETYMAFDLHSGKKLFQHTNVQDGYMYHSDVNSDTVYLLVARIASQQGTITNNTLYASQLSTGKVRWQYTANKIEEVSSGLSTDPVVAQ